MRRPRDERGLSESVQWAVLTPVLLLLIVGGIQAGIWLHGRTLAEQAAAGGAEAAAIAGGSPGAARDVAGRLAGDLRDVQIDVVESAGLVTVTVQGRTQTFIDLGQGLVRARASVPREPE